MIKITAIIFTIIFSFGITGTFDSAYAGCVATILPQPCFDSFMGYTDQEFSKKIIMENFHRHMESRYDELQIPDRTWDSYETPIQLPAILCTEFVVDNNKEYRMTKWVDVNKMSSWENHYNPLLCTQWLAPIDDGIKVKWDKELYESEDVGVVQVIDKSMNLNNQTIDSFDIHVFSDTDHTGIQLTVTETDENTGIFEGTTFFTTKHESSGHRLLVEDAVNAEHEGNRKRSKIINEPEEPTISDEQEQMMREYCETGIRHPDMMGIPQCIKNELVCGSGFELVDGICHLIITDFLTSEDHNGMGGFLLIGIPAIITIIIISVIGYKKSKK